MSWAAHELESYVLQKHVRTRVSYLAILLGCLLPDLFTKLPVYGLTVGPVALKASDPAAYHRGFPGVGFTHSLLFGIVVAAIVLALTRNRAWALGLLVGQWAHVLTDVNDTAGTMIFFPFSLQNYSTGMWAYAAQAGRYGDAAAYYSSLGGVWDLLWLLVAAGAWRTFGRDYFHGVVVPADPAWAWLKRKLLLPDVVLLAIYRAYFLYGACRIFAWTGWAHLVEGTPWDLSWGGPFFVRAADLSDQSAGAFLLGTLVGVAGLALSTWLLWRWVGRRLWLRAT